MGTVETIKTFARTTAFERIFAIDSVDCCFQFTDETTNEVKVVNAHRKVLGANSPVFATMFNGTWCDKTNAVIIKDTSYEAFDAFVKYFYQDSIDLMEENIVDMLTLADRYDIPVLAEHCESYILTQLSIDNALEYFPIAVRLGRAKLKVACEKLFTDKPKDILESESFTECDSATLASFLRLVPKSCHIENVFDACILWAEANCKENGKDPACMNNLRAELGECFELIRFKEMQFKALADRFKNFKMLFNTDEQVAILDYLLENTKTLFYLQPSNGAMLKWVGSHPKSKYDNVPRIIRFQLNKPALLDSFTFGRASINGKAVAFSASITVKQDRVIAKQTAEFTVDNLSFTFPKKLFIDAGKVYSIEYERNSFVVDGHVFVRLELEGMEFIPIQKKNNKIAEEVFCGITEIRFVDVDKQEIIE